MNNIPFSTVGLHDDEIDAFLDTYNNLRSKFDASFIDKFDIDFSKFESPKGYDNHELREVIQLTNAAYIAFVEVSYSYTGSKGARHSKSEFQIWGIARMHNNFGHLFIKREGFTEKLLDFIKPMELDFENDREFSKKFYVLAKDKNKATLNLSQVIRNAILNCKVKEFSLEILENTLIIGNSKHINPNEVLDLADFIDTVSKSR